VTWKRCAPVARVPRVAATAPKPLLFMWAVGQTADATSKLCRSNGPSRAALHSCGDKPLGPLQAALISSFRGASDPLIRSQVCAALHPCIPALCRSAMVHFNDSLSRAVVSERSFGRVGAPWEFNLRDVLRWCELAEAAVELPDGGAPADGSAVTAAVVATFPVVYFHRMRTAGDRAHTTALFSKHFGLGSFVYAPPVLVPGRDTTRLGVALLQHGDAATRGSASALPALLLRAQLPPMEAAAAALARGWMAILVGPAASGKTVLARSLALLAGARLHEVRAFPARARSLWRWK